MIRRIHIQRYKSLRDVKVALQPLSVLFGPNAAGKSNFIDALQLLSRIAGSRSLKEAFEPPYRGKPMESFSFDETGLEGLMKKESVSFQIEADIELSPAVIAAAPKLPSMAPRSGMIGFSVLRITHSRWGSTWARKIGARLRGIWSLLAPRRV